MENKLPQSSFGSHKSMVSKEWNKEVTDPNLVVLEILAEKANSDKKATKEFEVCSFYLTEKSRLDDGLADPNRYSPIKHRAKKLAQAMPKVIVQIKDDQILLEKAM